jgi:hypothetical protein
MDKAHGPAPGFPRKAGSVISAKPMCIWKVMSMRSMPRKFTACHPGFLEFRFDCPPHRYFDIGHRRQTIDSFRVSTKQPPYRQGARRRPKQHTTDSRPIPAAPFASIGPTNWAENLGAGSSEAFNIVACGVARTLDSCRIRPSAKLAVKPTNWWLQPNLESSARTDYSRCALTPSGPPFGRQCRCGAVLAAAPLVLRFAPDRRR